MILVDTSVLIDAINGLSNPKISLFAQILKSKIDLGISAFTYTEVLQGAKSDKEFSRLQAYFSTIKLYYPPDSHVFYEDSAKLYFALRKSGKTVRGTVDVFIAQLAIYYGFFLLHNDRDFDIIAEKTDLKILNKLEELAE